MVWDTFDKKIRGVSHEKSGAPCQDDYIVSRNEHGIIAVVADGHGSKACPYSKDGSRIAAEVVSEMFTDILSCNGANNAYRFIRQNIEDKVLKSIEYGWKSKVAEFHARNGREPLDREKLYVLYGTTLLALIVTGVFILAVQLGDGDILSVSDTGEISWIFDKEKIGTETESLCLKDSWKYIGYKLLPVVDDIKMPVLFTLSTDGYRDSFTEKEGFKAIGKDYLTLLRANGKEYIENMLEEWLYEASRNSGDDITLVGVFNEEWLKADRLKNDAPVRWVGEAATDDEAERDKRTDRDREADKEDRSITDRVMAGKTGVKPAQDVDGEAAEKGRPMPTGCNEAEEKKILKFLVDINYNVSRSEIIKRFRTMDRDLLDAVLYYIDTGEVSDIFVKNMTSNKILNKKSIITHAANMDAKRKGQYS